MYYWVIDLKLWSSRLFIWGIDYASLRGVGKEQFKSSWHSTKFSWGQRHGWNWVKHVDGKAKVGTNNNVSDGDKGSKPITIGSLALLPRSWRVYVIPQFDWLCDVCGCVMSPTSGIYWVELGFINNYNEPQLWLVLLRYNADVASAFPWVVTV